MTQKKLRIPRLLKILSAQIELEYPDQFTFPPVNHDVLPVISPPDDLGLWVTHGVAAQGHVLTLAHYKVSLGVFLQDAGWH